MFFMCDNHVRVVLCNQHLPFWYIDRTNHWHMRSAELGIHIRHNDHVRESTSNHHNDVDDQHGIHNHISNNDVDD